MFVNKTSQGEQFLLETVVMAAILLFLVKRACLYIKGTRFQKNVWEMSSWLFRISGLYPEGFLREYAKINIHSFLCYMQKETELTQTYKYILHTISWLSYGATFLREFNFWDRRFFLLSAGTNFWDCERLVFRARYEFFAIFRKWRSQRLLFNYFVSWKGR